jgi:hypothetical protein
MTSGRPGRRCAICISPAKAEIDRALAVGASPSALGRQYAVSADSIWRHKEKHLRRAVVVATDAGETDPCQADTVGGGVMADALMLQGEALSVLRRARRVGALDVALRAIDQSAKLLELAARLQGRLDNGARIAIGVQIGAAANAGAVRARITEKDSALTSLPSDIEVAPAA